MKGELFDSTIPAGEPELLKTSAYERYLLELDASAAGEGGANRLARLSPSLQADLGRYEAEHGGGFEVVEVVAACLRHASRVTMQVPCAGRVLPLTLFPQEGLVHCPMDLGEFIERHLSQLQVLHLEPATLRPPGDATEELVADPSLYHPLAPLLWALALRGPRRELLPEIGGPAVYRVSPALDLARLPVSGVLRAAIDRLRRQAMSLSGLAAWPAFDRERAARLLNALYLQSGLIVSRSNPAAVRESWFGG